MNKSMILAIALLMTLSMGASAAAENTQEFRMDQVFESEAGTCHYNLYVPDDCDGSKPYALHIALPGWEGLYFQGVGEDLRWEYLPFESRNYANDMIVVSAQLNDWGETSARQAVALTEFFLSEYNIDPDRVFITGYSGGGETLSRVMELKPELYTAALFVSSQWDGDPQPLVDARTPLYLFTAEHDSYYGSEPVSRAYQRIHDLYAEASLTEEEIASLLVMDIRPDEELDSLREENSDRVGTAYAMDYHGAGMLAAFDENVMKWVFQNRMTENKNTATIPQTGFSRPVPADYTTPSDHPGTVVRVDYDSEDYLANNAPVVKTAYVYLPYGYDDNDPETRYDILYLMHGWTGTAGEYFFIGDGMIKNMLDHLIENGEIRPIIAVSATFYNDSSDRGFGAPEDALREFHRDFEDYLMPAVEGTFHTYAKDTSPEGLIASRDHRAFGGFSLGSVTTWLQFCYDADYIHYFLPMSGSSWYYGTYGDFQIQRNVNHIPFGYKLEHQGRTNKKNQQVRDLVVDEDEAIIVREIFDLLTNHDYGTNRVAQHLNDRGIKTKRGTTLWRGTTIRSLIENPIYIGIYHMQGVQSEPFDHLKIIDEDLYAKCLQTVKGRSTKNYGSESLTPIRTDTRSLLTGIIYCEHCGCRLCYNHHHEVRKKADGSNAVYDYEVYRC